ncbi:hypothetical protein ACPF31_002156 [Vibrio cholerae]|uniref:ORC-CDC6 family AAA ATPase n=1 Tax=Vibrio cholerae TaxID=666 RepID=UPI000E0AE42D|nr:hypothetical protein [Vibrio cholerae]EMC2478124.1 hypothetical protein [Vibrio cholerae]MCD6643251.1 hypothetical protein [Vibrio cholerae]
MKVLELSDIFESSNARTIGAKQLSYEFIWTDSFSEILTENNQVILGSRGSGKTALVKMLSHSNLKNIKDERAQSIIKDKSIIATYVPLKVDWVNSVNNFGDHTDEYFKWSLNLSTCSRLIETIKSCIEEYIEDEIEQLRLESRLSKSISEFWLGKDKVVNNLSGIQYELERIEYMKSLFFNKLSMGLPTSDEENKAGESFHNNLFSPFSIVTKLVNREFGFDSEVTKWVLCIDEAEFLTEDHLKIINTHMRSSSDLYFKITTMPYRHSTLGTFVSANVNIHHDLNYVYIDRLGTHNKNQDIADSTIYDFAIKLFENRLKRYNFPSDIELNKLVGESQLTSLDGDFDDDEYILSLVEKHCTPELIARANSAYRDNIELYRNSIYRKLKGLLIIREKYQNRKGNSSTSVFSGVSVIARCSDGNPRRLFRLFKHLLEGQFVEQISPEVQTKHLKAFSFAELEVIKFERGGREAHELMQKLGNFFKSKTHVEKLGSNTPQAINIDPSLDDETWSHIKTAVDLGLLYPSLKRNSNVKHYFPEKEGDFFLAYCLAPYFDLFPRKDRSLKIYNVLNIKARSSHEQQELF